MDLLHPGGAAWASLLVALLADAAWGEPQWLYRRVPHPIVALGRCIGLLERTLYPRSASSGLRRVAGVALVLTTTGIALLLGATLAHWCGKAPGGWLLEGLLMSTLLAQRSLVTHVRAVADGLRDGLPQGRAAVAHIVGRDPEALDAAGVGRGAVESLAENLSDGVVAPLFWGVVAGLPGMLAYKALNTLDSMVGHRNERYREFGWASARLDDLANLIPARLTGLLVCLVGGRPRRCLRTMLRDAPGHRSPNAGWPEAAMAAALDVRLAGPRVYGGRLVEDGWMGDGTPEVRPQAIERGIELAWRVWWLLVAGVAGLALAA
ncbi:MAG: adenosylcobinamide-phosphate synthase CbiB [Geminicoccaceae bacterium]